METSAEPIIYEVGNMWQMDRYRFMTKYNRRFGLKDYAKPMRGTEYYGHLLATTPENELHQFLGELRILDEIYKRIDAGKLGDPIRLLTNTVASQPCCFNLFVPLKQNLSLASNLFSRLLDKVIQVRHIEIEFTPYVTETDDRHLKGFPFGGDESLGDQSVRGGTDADVVVFFTFGKKQRGVILIEFKYIEAEFSVCNSYKEKDIRSICDSVDFYLSLIAPDLDKVPKPRKSDCGYLKYNNWQLQCKSEVFDKDAIMNFGHCPFRRSLQQLWRNMLLAENVARVSNLDEFRFWVLAPEQNTALWEQKDETNVHWAFQKVLKPTKQDLFARKNLKKDFVDILKGMVTDEWERRWLNKFEERYIPEDSITKTISVL